ncbi:MAG TPA: zinc-ribbon domain-containing protein [Thermoplasmata archaeon]|nr:zinc-ribbon domain-containing protein [Thermoplasmata archaeon]
MGTPGQPGSRMCVQCGKTIAPDANVCPYCGHDYRVQAGPPAKKKTVMPVIGGILILVGGVLSLVAGIGLVASVGALDSLMIVDVEGVDMLEDLMTACGVIFIILGLIGVLGGVFAIMRKHFGLAILGGVFALAGWFIPALIGLILVGVSKDEFE